MNGDTILPAHDPFAHEPDSDWRGRRLSEIPKRCDRCGKYGRMPIVEARTQSLTRAQQMLLAIFAPGSTQLNQVYECPRCGNRIRELTFHEAVLAPMVIIGAMTLSLAAFLLFVFFVAAR